MDRLKRNFTNMMRARGPYEVFTIILVAGLAVIGVWATAALVGLWLIWMRDRVVEDDV
jgi:hypothetical protein